jgi:hypothetical protein
VFKDLFGSENIEKILFFILLNKKCYGAELKKNFKASLFGFQKALDRLERSSILVSFVEGKTRMYYFNPRYPFLKEFKIFLKKAYSFLPKNIRKKYYEPIVRKRPRRRGKPL